MVCRTSIQYGTGKGFPIQAVQPNLTNELEPIIQKIQGGTKFLSIINNGYSEKIAGSKLLQEMYEVQGSIGKYQEPTELVDEISIIINKSGVTDEDFFQTDKSIFNYKDRVPVKQLFALYAINKISSTANQK